MSDHIPAPHPTDLAPRLLPWFEAHGRDMPWRLDHHPYRLLVAVIMLQQTQVATVIPYHRRFLRAFPSLRALAVAPVEDVLKLWEGLGYYSRARNLHRAAQVIMAAHGGRVPRTDRELRALPGVGAYTAAAVRSIAFDEPVAAIDGNVLRILSRVFWLPGGGREGKEKQRAEGLAQAAVPPDHPGDYNQALMDLGAVVCTPRAPQCGVCPLGDLCRAYARGQAEGIPPRRRAALRTVHAVAGLVRKGGKLLLAQRPREGIWGGLWELPNVELADGADPAEAFAAYLREALGLQVELSDARATHTYAVTNRQVRLTVLSGTVLGGRIRCREHTCARWFAPGELETVALPAPHRKVLAAAAGGAAVGGAGY